MGFIIFPCDNESAKENIFNTPMKYTKNHGKPNFTQFQRLHKISHCKYSRERESKTPSHCTLYSRVFPAELCNGKDWRMAKKRARWANRSLKRQRQGHWSTFQPVHESCCYLKVYTVSKTRKLQKSFPSVAEGQPKLTRLRTYIPRAISEGKVSTMSALPSSLAGKVAHSHFKKLVSSLVKTALGS